VRGALRIRGEDQLLDRLLDVVRGDLVRLDEVDVVLEAVGRHLAGADADVVADVAFGRDHFADLRQREIGDGEHGAHSSRSAARQWSLAAAMVAKWTATTCDAAISASASSAYFGRSSWSFSTSG